jgi:tetratricopeptide (TPR) repeat protein
MSSTSKDVKNDKIAEVYRKAGNEFFIKKDFFKALFYYNETLCLAESYYQLALAYANRSAAYLELGVFERCLKNIQYAIDHGYSNLSKLDSRKKICQTRMKSDSKNPDSPWDFFKLTFEPNPKVPFVADVIGKTGNVLTATKDLKTGDVIAITDPFFRFTDPSSKLHRCSYCFDDCILDLIPCSGCANGKNKPTMCVPW